MLHPEELERLALRLAARPQGVTEAEAQRIGDWAESVRTDEALLDLVLKGLINVSWEEGATEPMFSAVRGN